LSPSSARQPDIPSLSDHLPIVDGLRGLAIVGVLWQHLTFSLIKPQPGGALNPIVIAFPFLTNGWHGVNLFFFLSGFVLALPYLSGRRTMSSGPDVRSFYYRRATRLLPLFYAVCLFSFVFFQNSYTRTQVLGLLATFSLLFNFSPRTYSPAVNWVFWSLGLEVWFSILFPLVLMAYSRWKWGLVTVAIVALSLCVRAVGYWLAGPSDTALQNAVSDSIIGRLDDFALGMTACHLLLTHRSMLAPFRHLLMAVGAASCLVSMALWNVRLTATLPIYIAPFLASLTNLGFLAMFLGLMTKRTAFANPLSSRILRLLGVMCYSVYAWHGVLLNKLNYVQTLARHSAGNTAAWLVAYVICVGLFATTTFVFIEFPGRGFGILQATLRRAVKTAAPGAKSTTHV
jgi:peptidoglycan/LPS O-acetylase OafA/YrhL